MIVIFHQNVKKVFKIGLKFEKVTVHTVCSAKGDSISERFTLWVKSPKKGAKSLS